MTFAPEHFTVWTEIPVSNLEKGMAFFDAVFQIRLEKMAMGPNETAMLPTKDGKGVAGHIYEGKPAGDGTGPTVHFAVPDTLEASMERVKSAGGSVISEPIPLPDGRFAYCLDPDGNSIGLFQYSK